MHTSMFEGRLCLQIVIDLNQCGSKFSYLVFQISATVIVMGFSSKLN